MKNILKIYYFLNICYLEDSDFTNTSILRQEMDPGLNNHPYLRGLGKPPQPITR